MGTIIVPLLSAVFATGAAVGINVLRPGGNFRHAYIEDKITFLQCEVHMEVQQAINDKIKQG